MLYRQLGRSDVKVSAISLGLWTAAHRIWSQPDGADRAVAIIKQSVDNGITTIDTASTYGFGWCDEVIGKAIKGKRDRVQISSKYGQRWDRPEGMFSFEGNDPQGHPMRVMRNCRPESIIEECDQILDRLGTDYIDLFQCHWPDPTTPITESMGAVAGLIKQGKVLAAGMSNFSVEQMDAANQVVPLASAQVPYSMVNREIEKELIPWCIQRGVSVLAYSPLQSGVLASQIVALSEDDPRRELACFKDDNLRKIYAFLQEVEYIAQNYNATIPQVVLNWTINRPSIASAICGALTIDEVSANVRAIELDLTKEDTLRINNLLDEMKLNLEPC